MILSAEVMQHSDRSDAKLRPKCLVTSAEIINFAS